MLVYHVVAADTGVLFGRALTQQGIAEVLSRLEAHGRQGVVEKHQG